ncbi:MAG: sugar ABC transporter ATP-binding protein [Fimbriimonadaceae bacterium]|nr:sugar ABC transporter ATP-binding protein [Fimbriimonadaceae bacterium]
MAQLAAQGLSVTYGGVEVLSKVDLQLAPGQLHALVGENGAGKSSLAKACAGVVRPSAGAVAVDDVPVEFHNPRQALEAGVCLVHQEPQGFPDLTVAENIAVGAWPRKPGRLDWQAMAATARGCLASVGFTVEPRRRLGSLSAAERQAVELAHGLARGARVWFFDETSAALTPAESERLFAVMRRLADDGCAVAFVTHHLQEVVSHADVVTVLRDGKVVGHMDKGTYTTGDLVKLMVGRSVELDAPGPQGSGEVVLQVESLGVRGVVHDVSFEVNAGEVVALAGLVGAGRTDVAQAICGLRRHTGKVSFLGRDLRKTSAARRWRAGIGSVPEDRQHQGLLLPLSVATNATLASLGRTSVAGWLMDRRMDDATKEVGRGLGLVFRGPDQEVCLLSGGNQQKVVLAKALLARPKLLVLDEPTRGVDIGAKYDIHRLIRQLAGSGVAVLVVSSDLPEVMALAHRVIVMRQGRVAGQFDHADASPERIIALASGGAGALAS